MVLRYTAGQTDAGRKVYSILRRELRISQTLTRRLKQAGGIRVDGRPVFTDYAVQPGETVEIESPPPNRRATSYRSAARFKSCTRTRG
jgi:23S rRNA-/tRNA-specific pseudouridylate synthase